ncbi:hypothetical protein QM806_04615 [Rhodococcus sp. IEGM 1351]|uniref:hypothetical protein n=1 Tax=Rhodococcus sp. IEGM 1351 TaxID=3047089 RepID=UPI0024B68821|nr:hypothetical protein [Rhodococcus sp. IEGM 1351]MDI9934738.1 hypothetical protein [Rhodococcus sp. IEGM 1351]
MERQPNPERWDDETLIDYEIAASDAQDRPINDAAARMIASQWHNGQASAMYSFVSTGEITPEFVYELGDTLASIEEPERRQHLRALVDYVYDRDEITAVEGWSRLWLKQPDDQVDDWADHDLDNCPACGSHVAEPHANGCPLDEAMFDE